MASLQNVKVKDSYTSLLKLDGNTDSTVAASSGNAVQVKTGDNDATPLYLNTDKVGIGTGAAPAKNILHVSDGSTSIADNSDGILISSATTGKLIFEDTGEGANDKLMMLNHYDESLKIMSINDAQDSWEDYQIATFNRNGHVGFGTLTPSHGRVEIVGNSDAFQLTMSDVADSDDTTKEARMGMLHYKQAEEPVTLFYAQSGSSENAIYIGGGTGVGNHATSVAIATASTYNSTSTTTNMKIDNNSRISLSNNDGNTDNTVFGYNAFTNNGTVLGNVNADRNVAIGNKAMGTGTTTGGYNNVAIGHTALEDHTSADSCVAIGSFALQNVTSGIRNLGIGTESGGIVTTGSDNISIGTSSNLTSSSASNQIVIGVSATAQGDNSVTLGNASVTDVYMSQDSQAYVHAQNVPNHVANTMSSPYYRFDGSNDQIDIADNAALDLSAALSIECLFKTEKIDTFQELVNKADAAQSYSSPYRLNITDGGLLNATVANGSASNTAVTSSQLVASQWYHAVFTADGSNLKLYVNGTLVDTESQTVTPETQNGILTIGRWGDTGGEFYPFAGEIQKVKLYNKALTATEVKEMYSGTSVPFKYKGANQTNLITGWTNSGSYGFANWDATGSTINQFDGDGTLAYAYTNTIPFVVGAKYRLTVVLDNTSGSLPNLMIAEVNGANSISGTDGSFNFAGTELADGTNTFEFTATSAFTTSKRVVLQENATSVNNSATFELIRIGAVAEYDGSGAGETIWGDKSGNDLHGTVSGATLENTPYDSGTEYEEGYHTAVITPSVSGSVTQDSNYNQLAYTKVGRLVTVTGRVYLSAISSPNGHINITMPFTVADLNQLSESGSASVVMLNTTGANVGDFVALFTNGSATLEIYIGDGTTVQSDSANALTATSNIFISAQYFTA